MRLVRRSPGIVDKLCAIRIPVRCVAQNQPGLNIFTECVTFFPICQFTLLVFILFIVLLFHIHNDTLQFTHIGTAGIND